MSPNSRKVYLYVKEHDGEEMTAQSIADALGMSVKSVNAIVTSSFQRHKEVVDEEGNKEIFPVMTREEATVNGSPKVILDAKGNPKKVINIVLTDFGRNEYKLPEE